MDLQLHDAEHRKGEPMKLDRLCRNLVLSCATAFASLALAQEFPARQPVKLIVTFAPGGGSDTIARTLNTKIGEALGQTVIVENKAGAGGAIATDFVAKSAPDGYNVLFTVSSHSINQALVPALPFDTERDLRGVTLIGALPQILAVHPSTPAGNLQEWIALGRKEPRYQQYATGGIGSPGHFAGRAAAIAGEAFARARSVQGCRARDRRRGRQPGAGRARHAERDPSAHQGRPPQGDCAHVQEPLAAASRRRHHRRVGFSRLRVGYVGRHVRAARRRPMPSSRSSTQATLAALKDPAVAARMESQAGFIIGGSPAELDALVSREIRQFTQVVREQGLKPE
jgi:tripartite-type tricarboxylate transporter receptor subunit TctC